MYLPNGDDSYLIDSSNMHMVGFELLTPGSKTYHRLSKIETDKESSSNFFKN